MNPEISTTMRTSPFKSWTLKSKIALAVAAAFLAFALWPLPERARRVPYSRAVLARDGSLLRPYISSDQKWRFRVEAGELPKHLIDGLICLEDRHFYWHSGVDPFAVVRAASQNIRHGRVVSGASTLTMQVARLLEPRPRRWDVKIREAIRAVQLDLRFSKKEILGLYLSYAPFGRNIEGIEAAARRYYGKPARDLNPAETAFLFLLPQSPKRWSARDNESLKALRDRQLARYAGCGVIDRADLARLEKEPIPEWKGSFETYAPHLADWVSGSTSEDRLVTTVDREIQKSVEDLVSAGEAGWRAQGIMNVGVMVVDNSTGEIRAAVGNFDRMREGDAQQYNSFLVPRSTGSLLKSFLYGRLLESGELLPESLLEDVPVDLNGYKPQNYNGEFQGLVEARMALAHSLNVPWIRALRAYGVDAFMSYLLSTGLQTPQGRQDVGVSMIVGGLQANLKDLTMLYRALADDGRMRKLSVRAGESERNLPWSWMNPAAAHLVREALHIRGRPDFAIDPRYLSSSNVRWKTGTSQGNLDAWAIGFDHEWTVGVWFGNLDRRPSPALVGPEVSAPLMFDTFSRLRKQAPAVQERWLPMGTAMVEVCAFSGMPAGPACPTRKQVLGIKGVAMKTSCPYHQHILVDRKTGTRITKECETEKMDAQVRAALDLPPDVADWTKQNLSGVAVAPAFHKDCKRRPVARGGMQILSPEATTYVLHSGESEKTLSVPLKLKTMAAAGHWRCYLNGRALPEAVNGEDSLLKVRPGDHSLLCADEQGRSDQVDFSVEL
jgi:penicillin-binding protein 1C